MKRVRHTPERVINKLREVETLLAGGRTVAQVVVQCLGVSEATFNRWRNQHGGIKASGPRGNQGIPQPCRLAETHRPAWTPGTLPRS